MNKGGKMEIDILKIRKNLSGLIVEFTVNGKKRKMSMGWHERKEDVLASLERMLRYEQCLKKPISKDVKSLEGKKISI